MSIHNQTIRWDSKISIAITPRQSNAIALWKALYELSARYEIEQNPEKKEALGLAYDKVWSFIQNSHYMMSIGLIMYKDSMRNAG